MKKWILVAVLCLLAVALVYASVRCPTCGSYMTWTGDTEYKGGHRYKLYECLNGHYWWIQQMVGADLRLERR